MASSVYLVITTALSVTSGFAGNNDAVSVVQREIHISGGFNPMVDCKDMELEYHNGNKNIHSRGNKTISETKGISTNQEYEITTFCLERKYSEVGLQPLRLQQRPRYPLGSTIPRIHAARKGNRSIRQSVVR